MPHVNIKYFPVILSEAQKDELVSEISNAVQKALNCDPGVISIALEPTQQDVWNEQVYIPEIEQKKDLLCKKPNY
ncbi:tautomerase family protein [Zooshikella harenae]|uniref:Tautomerase family protein n=1 Tax=Zooshikella harenae TaxID=2827238 RepID=A0ABS5ZG42_9GAMM|nr:tautomerase family protein [Zooshikella harenae]MBU2712979.1 tautomerase family protein [Zooshikella harenae]